MSNSINPKLELVKRALLVRLTDFELATNDEEFFNLLEDLRDYIVRYKLKNKKIEADQLELFGSDNGS